MAVNVYEGMYIFDPGRFARDAAGVSGKIEKMVNEAGGELLVSRLWEERRLAYPIKGNRKGTYWLTYFRADSQQLTGMNRQCEISDDVMRHLIIKIDDRIVDALVSHAQGSPAATKADGNGKAADKDKAADKAKAADKDKAADKNKAADKDEALDVEVADDVEPVAVTGEEVGE